MVRSTFTHTVLPLFFMATIGKTYQQNGFIRFCTLKVKSEAILWISFIRNRVDKKCGKTTTIQIVNPK